MRGYSELRGVASLEFIDGCSCVLGVIAVIVGLAVIVVSACASLGVSDDLI